MPCTFTQPATMESACPTENEEMVDSNEFAFEDIAPNFMKESAWSAIRIPFEKRTFTAFTRRKSLDWIWDADDAVHSFSDVALKPSTFSRLLPRISSFSVDTAPPEVSVWPLTVNEMPFGLTWVLAGTEPEAC